MWSLFLMFTRIFIYENNQFTIWAFLYSFGSLTFEAIILFFLVLLWEEDGEIDAIASEQHLIGSIIFARVICLCVCVSHFDLKKKHNKSFSIEWISWNLTEFKKWIRRMSLLRFIYCVIGTGRYFRFFCFTIFTITIKWRLNYKIQINKSVFRCKRHIFCYIFCDLKKHFPFFFSSNFVFSSGVSLYLILNNSFHHFVYIVCKLSMLIKKIQTNFLIYCIEFVNY